VEHDPKKLRHERGYLKVRGPSGAHVYVNGVDLGSTDALLEAPCGRRFVRVGLPPDGGRFPTWLAEGETVNIGCRAVTEATMAMPR